MSAVPANLAASEEELSGEAQAAAAINTRVWMDVDKRRLKESVTFPRVWVVELDGLLQNTSCLRCRTTFAWRMVPRPPASPRERSAEQRPAATITDKGVLS